MKRFAIVLLFLFATSAGIEAQTAVPLGGVGSLQFFQNDGTLLSSGYVYLFQSGTSTPITVYTDSTATTTQPNPVPLAAGARASIWLPAGTTAKVTLCLQNDGAACNGSDVIFSADNVLVSGGGSGGGCGSTCTSIFISSTPSSASSGALRLASGDQICFRNASGSANLCLSKDPTDLFSIPTSWKMPAITFPSGQATFGVFGFDNNTNRLAFSNNGSTKDVFVGAASTDTFTNKTYDTGGSGNVFKIAGVPISNVPEGNLSWTEVGNGSGFNVTLTAAFFPNAHTITRFLLFYAVQSTGCTTQPVYSIIDDNTSTTLTTLTGANSVAFVDSGALSIATTAGHRIRIAITTVSNGCSVNGSVGGAFTYQ